MVSMMGGESEHFRKNLDFVFGKGPYNQDVGRGRGKNWAKIADVYYAKTTEMGEGGV